MNVAFQREGIRWMRPWNTPTMTHKRLINKTSRNNRPQSRREIRSRARSLTSERINQSSLTVYPVSLPDASSAIFLSRSRSSSRPLLECPSCSQLPNTSRGPPMCPPFCPPFFNSAAFCCLSLRRQSANFNCGSMCWSMRHPMRTSPIALKVCFWTCICLCQRQKHTYLIKKVMRSMCLSDLDDGDHRFIHT